jgi:hypothetical protein
MSEDLGPTPPPSASGARLAGDDLQHLIGWYWALKTCRPEHGVTQVTYESLNAGNLDDVVIERDSSDPPEYWQVKTTRSAGDPVSTAWLTKAHPAGSLLRRFWRTYQDLHRRRGVVQLVLATNRSLDPSDPVLATRDESYLLAPRLRREPADSAAGLGRRDWADHLEISEADLLEMLDVLQFRTDITETTYREKVADVSVGLGLKTDEATMLAGIGTVRNWIKASRIERTRADVEKIISDLGLRVAPPRGVLLVQALERDEPGDATAALDWVDRFLGDDRRTRRGLRDASEWNTVLLPDIRDAVRQVRARYTTVIVRGEMRLPTWFAIGTEMSEVSGFVVASAQLGDLWSSDAPVAANRPELTISDPRELGEGRDLAITLALADDPTADVLAFLRTVPSVGKHRTITLPAGPHSRSIASPIEAVALARAIRSAVRQLNREERPARIHLFLAAPHGVVLLLGHLWDRMPETQLYEDLTGAQYQAAFRIRNSATGDLEGADASLAG